MKINRLLTLIALPVFVVVIVVGVDRIEKVDKYLLIGTTIFYVVVRIILLEFAIVFDYQNIAVDDYFNAKFYTHFILSVISFAIMFGAIYYVLNYKLELHRNWIVFFGMIIVDQVVVFTYQIVLVYLFNRNFSVSGEFYKGVMVFPVFMLTLVSAMATIMFKETRTRIIKLFNAV